MTECEIYMTLATRNIYDNDCTKPLKIKDRVKYFASTYKARRNTRSWVFCGHPVTVSACNCKCHDCWEYWMEEFVRNKEDHCDL